MSESALPENITMEQVLEAMKAQTRAQQISNQQQPKLDKEQVTRLLDTPFQTDTFINAQNKNSQRISCVFCRTIILAPNTASYEEKLISLPPLLKPVNQSNDTSSPSFNDHQHIWRVEGQMSFENVGVSRPADPTLKYLLCGECDRGPIGLTYINQPNIFYVAHGTIAYT